MQKREFLTSAAALGGSLALFGGATSLLSQELPALGLTAPDGKYSLPALPYSYNALEPAIDEKTLKTHHDLHHAGYVKGLNNAVDKIQESLQSEEFALIKHWEKELAFHGGGHYLHTLYWNSMTPKKTSRSATLNSYIDKSFGSYNKFTKYIKAVSNQVEGSGWGILAYEPAVDRLTVLQCEKHNDLTNWAVAPLMSIDVWEHAYYLKYQNKRADYLDGFFNVVNWDFVSNALDAVLSRFKK
ncbi:MAG: superoxide dismutase [Chloroflexota bacterium]